MRLAFRVAYLGDNFSGSQMQPDRRTVEGEFIVACRNLNLFADWREAGFAFAGRTDAGVHANAQICAFSTDQGARAVAVLNRMLPEDCWCTGWAEVDGGFHPRYAGRSRTYRYFFPAQNLDFDAMKEAAAKFRGTHNFSRFARVREKNPLRTVLAADMMQDADFFVFEVRGKSFLWNMVRCMATTLERAGRGEMSPEEIAWLLAAPDGDRIPTARPEGLILWDVDCTVAFRPMERDPRSSACCRERIRDLALRKKVVGELCGSRLDLRR
jgi:tRNA pseudouridine38-40 synthase